MSKNEKLLIIVESPSKTKTISKYVDNASVIASVGHFKDLPKNAQKYIKSLEEFIETKVASISTSPERKDTILIENPFAS